MVLGGSGRHGERACGRRGGALGVACIKPGYFNASSGRWSSVMLRCEQSHFDSTAATAF